MSVPAGAATATADSGLPQRSSRTRDERRQQRRNRQHNDADDDDDDNNGRKSLGFQPTHTSQQTPQPNTHDDEPQPMIVSPTNAATSSTPHINPSNSSATPSSSSSSSSTSSASPPCFEYLDHTADIQFHAWGATLSAAFANLSLCMHSFLTDTSLPPPHTATTLLPFTLTSHSLPSLLFHYLDESLYLFLTTDLLIVDVVITQLASIDHSWLIQGEWHGVTYNGDIHGRGTEVKAITYSNMQLYVDGKRVGEEAGTGGDVEETASAAAAALHGADLYVIVDI